MGFASVPDVYSLSSKLAFILIILHITLITEVKLVAIEILPACMKHIT